jgi:hypothetical protein
MNTIGYIGGVIVMVVGMSASDVPQVLFGLAFMVMATIRAIGEDVIKAINELNTPR